MSKKSGQVAVVFISGQSNAHAHGQVMEESDRVVIPFKNVFSLDRNPNQSFDITDVVWSGFTTEGKNLGEIQDHTYSLAYFLAKKWQDAINQGCDLPDLYIVQMSIGAQGIINGMWNPDQPKRMTPGILGEVDISLFPWALQINRLVISNLKRNGKQPQVIGWHWIGSEQEIWEQAYDRADLKQRYNEFFDQMLESMGEACPLYLYKLCLQRVCDKEGLPYRAFENINEALREQISRHENVTFVETDKSPYWDEEDAHSGIFGEDEAHYNRKVQEWFAQQFFEEFLKTRGK